MTIKQLQATYKRFNKRWFDNRLPAEIAMSYEDMTASPNAGLCTTYQEPGSPPIHSLHFDRRFQDCDTLLKFFLIHECCHISAYPREVIPHDQSFQNEMIILAFKGALKDLW